MSQLRERGGQIIGVAGLGTGCSKAELGLQVPATGRCVPQDAGHSRRDAGAPLWKRSGGTFARTLWKSVPAWEDVAYLLSAIPFLAFLPAPQI